MPITEDPAQCQVSLLIHRRFMCIEIDYKIQLHHKKLVTEEKAIAI
jgi:hypothetical protein